MTDRRARRDPYAAPPRPARSRDRYDDDDGYVERYEPPDSGRPVSPGAIFLVIAIIGSIAFTAYFLTVREARQIPLLAAASIVLAIVFAALAAYCLRSVWRGGVEHVGGGRLLLIALVGGVAAMAAAGAAAGAVILFQLALTSG
jgi:hypothetical protein